MHQARIAIVEDELIITNVIQKILEGLNYIVLKPCTNYDDAIHLLDNEKPDLVLLDIQLDDKKDGVLVGEYIRKQNDIPIIFISSSADAQTVERVKKVRPDAYLVKPFEERALLIAIELALSNFNHHAEKKTASNEDNYLVKDSLFIKDGAYFHKIKFDEILYLGSEGVYVTFVTEKKKYLVRGSIPQYMEKMNDKRFFRVHRSYAVNLDKMDTINTSAIYITGQEIPISKNYRDELLRFINIE